MSHIVGANELVKKDTCTKNVDNMLKELNDIKISIAKLPETILEKADIRYAGKLSEKLVYGMVVIVLGSVMSSLVYLVVRPNNDTALITKNADDIQEIKDLIIEAME